MILYFQSHSPYLIQQATNTTEMWILTNGINVGVSKIIGDAVHEELKRRNSKGHFHKSKSHHSGQDSNSRIVLVGVAREDLLNHAESFEVRDHYLIYTLHFSN